MSAFDDPAYRASLTPEQYERERKQWLKDNTVGTENGYILRTVQSRFGTLVMVDGANVAFDHIDKARAHARALPPNPDPPE